MGLLEENLMPCELFNVEGLKLRIEINFKLSTLNSQPYNSLTEMKIPVNLTYLREPLPFPEFLSFIIEVPVKMNAETRKIFKSIFNRLSGGPSPSPSSQPDRNKAMLIKTIKSKNHANFFDFIIITSLYFS